MRPTRVQARNFRSYSDLDLQLPDGPTAIIGNNGAGKSSLLTMIELGLFAGRGELGSPLYLSHGADSVEVTVYVDHQGETYRVRRGAGKKSYLDFEHLDPGVPEGDDYLVEPTWMPIPSASQAETQDLINKTFGMDGDIYGSSSYLGQGRGSFAGSGTTPAQRMRLFSSLIGLGLYEHLATEAAQQRRQLATELAAVNGRLEGTREQLAGRQTLERQAEVLAQMVAEAEEALAAAEERIETERTRYTQAMEKTAQVATARMALSAAESEHKRLAQITTDAESARGAIAPLEQEKRDLMPLLEELPAVETEVERVNAVCHAHARLVSEYEAAVSARRTAESKRDDLNRMAKEANAEKDRLRRKAATLAVGSDCPTCGQAMLDEALKRAADSFLFDANTHASAALELSKRAEAVVIPEVGEPPAGEPPTALLASLQARARTGSDANVKLATLRERISGLQQKIKQAEDPSYRKALTVARRATDVAEADLEAVERTAASLDVEQIKQAGTAARAQVAEQTQRLQTSREQKTRADAQLEQLTELEQRTAADRERATVLEAQVDVLAAAELAHGRTGIPALILENRVGEIEQQATQILSELGGDTAGARIEIRTQKPNKDGTVQERLDVVLVTPDGYDQPFDGWSGGEQLRINVALRWALAAGTGVEIVILDEPAALDDEGKAALRDIIDFLIQRGVRTVLVVSHEQGLRDTFEQVLEVRKDGAVSMVVSEKPELVPA